MSIASVVGGVVGSVIPVVGTIVGSTVGMMIAGVWGAGAASQIRETQELKGLKNEARSAISQAMQTAYTSSMDMINELVATLQTESASALKSMIAEVTKNLISERESLAQRKNLTQKEIIEKQKIVEGYLKGLNQLEAKFKQIHLTV